MKEVPIERLKELFRYCPETGALTWIKPPKMHPRMMGAQAGSLRTGYLFVQIDGVKIGAHRICFAIHHNRWPNGMIDHKNRDRTDNRISNLRECDHFGNARNHSRTMNGSGLPTGVRRNSGGKFSARISFNKQLRTIGTFETVEAAASAYQEARELYFGEFA
jgi:hypothetical protein